MAIFTSRYGNKELRKDGYYPVGISIGKPRFKTGYEIREQCYALAPKGYMLKMDYEPYRQEYFKKLEDIGADKIIGIVQRMDERAQEEGKTLVLLCYEDLRKPGSGATEPCLPSGGKTRLERSSRSWRMPNP